MPSLQELICEMHQHTRRGQDTRHHAERTVSFSQVRAAPVTRLSPAERDARMAALLRRIEHDLLNSPIAEANVLRERLSHWKGVRIS